MKKEKLLNKYIKYNSKITFDIFKLIYQKLIDLGFTTPHEVENAFKEFSGKYQYFVMKVYDDELYFNQFDSGGPRSEISVEDLLGYNPFESFKLPEKWCIKVTKDNKSVLSKWRTDGYCVVGTYLLSPYHPMDSCSKIKIGYGVPNIPEDTVEITFTQFKQYVLKEPVVTKPSKPFPSRWCIELNKTTIPIVGNYYNKKHLNDPNCVTYTECAEGYYVRSHNNADEYVKNGYNYCSFFDTPSDEYPEITLEEFKQIVMEETTNKTEKDWSKATKEELLEEARRKYPMGTEYNPLGSNGEIGCYIKDVRKVSYSPRYVNGGIECGIGYIYAKGNWAKIISLPETKVEEVVPEYVECFYSESDTFIINKIYKCEPLSRDNALNLNSEGGLISNLPYKGGLWKFKPSTKEAFEAQNKSKSIEKWSVGSYIVPLQNKLLTRTEPLIKGKPYRIIKNTGVPYIICEKGVEINFSIDSDTEKNEGIKWFVTLTEAEEFAKTLIAPPKFEVGDIIQANPGGSEYEENGLEQPSAISYLKVDDVTTGKCTKITYSQQHRCYWYKIDNYGNMFTEDCITLAEVKSYDLYILNTIYKIEENGKFCLCKYTGMKDSYRMKGYTLSDMNNTLEFEYDAVYISGRDVSLASREECDWLELCIKYNKLMDKPSLHQAVHCQTQEEWDFVNLKMKFTAKFGISSCVRYLDDGCISSIEYFKERHLDNYQLLSFQEWCDLNGYKMKKTRFKTGDYVVSLRPERLSTVSIKFNYCYIQYKDGDKISIDSGTTMYEDDINYARLATPEEIEEYKRIGKPYDVTTLQPIINTYGLNIGDKLDAVIIAVWEKKDFNYFSDPSKGWVFGNGSAYDGNRKIENFKVIDGVVGFLVSGTLKIYLRAEGFKEFSENYNKPKEPVVKFEIGKWYKVCDGNSKVYNDPWYVKSPKIVDDIVQVDQYLHNDRLLERGNFGHIGDYTFVEVPLSEIQHLLPEGHPDKFVKSTKISMGMKILSSSFYGSPSIKKTKSDKEEIYLLSEPD